MIEVLDALCEALKRFEGCRLTAYQDCVGVWTIGYGETLGITQGMEWTQEQADSMLRRRAAYFLLHVYQKCSQLHVEPPGRVAACGSLAYNIGIGAFGVSSVSRKTKRKDYSGAANSFLLWNKAGGFVRKGLTFRRKAERAMYLLK